MLRLTCFLFVPSVLDPSPRRSIIPCMEKETPAERHCENWAVILVSLAALATAWCAYQSNIWTGNQEVDLAQADQFQVEASREYLSRNEHQMMHGFIVLKVIESLADGDMKRVETFLGRMSADLRSVVQAWLAQDPLNSKDAPPSPLLTQKYKDEVLAPLSRRLHELEASARENNRAAARAGNISDSYVLLTVLLAMVLFFGGISSAIHSLSVRRAVLVCASVLFLFVAIRIGLLA